MTSPAAMPPVRRRGETLGEKASRLRMERDRSRGERTWALRRKRLTSLAARRLVAMVVAQRDAALSSSQVARLELAMMRDAYESLSAADHLRIAREMVEETGLPVVDHTESSDRDFEVLVLRRFDAHEAVTG